MLVFEDAAQVMQSSATPIEYYDSAHISALCNVNEGSSR